jgi:hypothetical protein
MVINVRKTACLFTLILLLIVSFTSIASAQALYYPTSWNTLTVSTNLSGAGSVYPGTGQYAYGSTVTATEYTNLGYSFNGWYLNGVYEGQLSSISVTMTQNYNLQAVFSVQVVALTITSNPAEGGTIAPGTGIWNYTSRNSVVVTESPNPGFTFSGWYLDGVYAGAGTGITVPMLTDHQLNAFFAGNSTNPTPPPTPTSTPTPTPQPTPAAPNLPNPSLTFYCTSSTTFSGFNVQIQGEMAYNGVGISGAGILLSYSVTGGATWQDLAYVNTGDYGNFSAVWMPSASGNYVVKATWPGDSVTSGVIATVNFAVAPFDNQDQNIFSVTSNSTLSSLTFDSTQNQLSFVVSGPAGTVGYVQICIPKSLMTDVSKLSVALDGQAVPFSIFSQGDVWLITLQYHHSTHSVVMSLNSQISTNGPTSTATSGSTTTPSSTPASFSTTLNNLLGGQLIFVAIIAVLVAVIAALLLINRRKTKSATTA